MFEDIYQTGGVGGGGLLTPLLVITSDHYHDLLGHFNLRIPIIFADLIKQDLILS